MRKTAPPTMRRANHHSIFTFLTLVHNRFSMIQLNFVTIFLWSFKRSETAAPPIRERDKTCSTQSNTAQERRESGKQHHTKKGGHTTTLFKFTSLHCTRIWSSLITFISVTQQFESSREKGNTTQEGGGESSTTHKGEGEHRQHPKEGGWSEQHHRKGGKREGSTTHGGKAAPPARRNVTNF